MKRANMAVGKSVSEYREEIIKHTCELIRIKSVASPALEGMPNGEGAARALEYVLSLGEKLGFRTVNIDGYGGHVEYEADSVTSEDIGSKEKETVGVLVHLDVVPEGDNWKHGAFSGEIDGNRIYGRGASDDKCSAAAAIYGLKALKDSGLPLKRKIRIIFGIDEETGMECMDRYFSVEPIPDMGFSPDASYPVVNSESAILQLELTPKADFSVSAVAAYPPAYPPSASVSGIVFIEGGTAINTTPQSCVCRLDGGRIPARALNDMKERSKAGGYSEVVSFSDEDKGRPVIECRVKEGYAGINGSVNMIYHMADILSLLPADDSGASRLTGFIGEYLKFDEKGAKLGIEQTYGSISTLVRMGKIYVNTDEGLVKAYLDIRYPSSISRDEVFAAVSGICGNFGIEAGIHKYLAPLYIPEDSALIKCLQRAYTIIMGEPAGARAMPGGTYARKLGGRGAAFGNAGANGHNAEEYVDIDELMTHAQIMTQAMYELAGC